MNIAPDKILHLKLGAAVALILLAVVMAGTLVSVPLAVALGAGAAGIGFEVVQKIRGDGTPSWGDAAASSAPGFALAALLWIFGV